MTDFRTLSLGLALAAAVSVTGAFAQPSVSQPTSQPTTEATTLPATQATSQPASPAVTAPVINERCPVMGLPINPDIHVDYQGQRVYFCCQACPAMFEGNPQQYVGTLPQFAPADASMHSPGEHAPGHSEMEGSEMHGSHDAPGHHHGGSMQDDDENESEHGPGHS